MDQQTAPAPVAASSRTHSRPSPRRTPSELSALSKSILSLHDDLSLSHDTTSLLHDQQQQHHATDSGSDRSGRRRHRSKRDREREREREREQEIATAGGGAHARDTAPLLAAPTRSSSFSFSSRSLDAGNYSDSFEGSSPLLYGDSFVDHQPLQRHFHDRLHQEQQHQQLPPIYGSDRPASQHTVHYDPQHDTTPQVRLSGFNPSSSPRQSCHKSSPPNPSPLQGPSVTSTRSHSFSSQAHLANSRQPTGQGESSGSSPKLSDRSSDSDHHNRDVTEDTLIMPQIITGSEQDLPHIGTFDQDRRRPSRTVVSSSPTVLEVMGPLPRMMTPSPVPLHARLSRIQKEAKKGARVIDMETNGSSHHYDYEDVTDSSHDFSSRRHSVAEEDVCYPLPATDMEINYTALEDYIRLEQIKTQKMMSASENGNGAAKTTRGPQARTKSATGGLLSKLRGASFTSSTPLSIKSAQDSNYGSIPGKNFGIPERSYSLFGERDKTQVPLDDAYRFTLYSTASVTVHAQTLGEIPPRGQTLSNLLQAGYFWLDVLAPTDEEIRMLSQVFKVHPLTTEDILMEEGREKCEMFLNYYFVCFRTFVLDPSSHSFLNPMSIYTLVFPGGIISYHFRPVPHCRNVRKRIRHLKDRIEVTPDWINYAIIDDIVDTFAPLIGEIEAEVDMIDELVLILKESEQSDMLRRIGNCRKRVMSLLRLLTGKADVIKGLIKRYEGRMGRKNMGEIGLFMGDIQDHIITMLQNLSHYEKILSRSHSNYLAQINIEMTSASNETNDVLTKLTVLGSIVLPMNLVTGLWGMNVPVPGQESEDLAWFFWITVKIAVIGGSGLYNLEGLEFVAEVNPDTPWGKPSDSITIAKTASGLHIAFLARHGRGHYLTPSEVPARANIAALKSLGVEAIIAYSAVGSLREELKPRDFVLPTQIIDRTKGIRPSTFFEDGLVAHAMFADPFSAVLEQVIWDQRGVIEGGDFHRGKTLICMEGPQFSTRAESHMYRSFGADLINMSVLPEAKLAREAEIAYQMVCMSTDYDCWKEHEVAVTVEAVVANLKQNSSNAQRLLGAILPGLERAVESGAVMKGLKGSMRFACMTAPEKRSAEAVKKLEFLLPGYYTA
ncbi:CorA metal ion transporter [Mortierella sp. 14UC]|nr:CorA metal ion transporter [Mortierella sp. 14UC]